MTNTWITSDTHFNHKNIIKYCGRPFYNVHEMNYTIIERWNECIKPNDNVMHLGDFGFGSKQSLEKIFKKLNGNITLFIGNHDKKKIYNELPFWNIKQGVDDNLYICDQQVLRCHYPYPESMPEGEIDKFAKRRPIDIGQWLICGHIHEKWKLRGRMINVGVDVWDFRPVHFDQIVEICKDGGMGA